MKSYEELVVELYKSVRKELKAGVRSCTEKQQDIFMIMYSGDEPVLSIDEIVDNMPGEKLAWAMKQVQRTLNRNAAHVSG